MARVRFPNSRHGWVEFVVGSRLCYESFFSGYSDLPSSQKPTFPNFHIFKYYFIRCICVKLTAYNSCSMSFVNINDQPKRK